jgi:hypothetical protein
MLAETRHALADKLSTIPELQVTPYMLSDPTPPAAHVFPTPVVYDTAFQRGDDDWTFTLQVFVSTGSGDQAAQRKLDAFIEPEGPKSVKAKLEEPDTEDGRVSLGGVISDLHVTRCEGYRLYAREGRAPLFGSEWTIKVSAPGEEA